MFLFREVIKFGGECREHLFKGVLCPCLLYTSHGTISLIEDGTLVVSLATQDMLFDKMMSNVKEVKARGAVVLGLTTEKHKEIEKTADHVFYIPSTEDILLPSLAVVPLQLFAYYVASMKG